MNLPEITHCFVCELPLRSHAKEGEDYCKGNHYEMPDGSIVNVPPERMREIRAADERMRKANEEARRNTHDPAQ